MVSRNSFLPVDITIDTSEINYSLSIIFKNSVMLADKFSENKRQ